MLLRLLTVLVLVLSFQSFAFAEMKIDNAGRGTKGATEFSVNEYIPKKGVGNCPFCDAKTECTYFINRYGKPAFEFERDKVYIAQISTYKTHHFSLTNKKWICHEGVYYYRVHGDKVYFAVGESIPDILNIPYDISNDERFANFGDLTWAEIDNGRMMAKGGWRLINRLVRQADRKVS